VWLSLASVLVLGLYRGERSSALEWAPAQPQPTMTAALPGDGPESMVTPLASIKGAPARPNADLAALEEMLRGSKGRLQHWTHAPELVVLLSVMDYRGEGGAESVATDTTMTDAEVDGLVSDLTAALATLTDHKYVEFAAVRRETPAAGSRASISRRGQIVVGRYSGVRALAKTIGFGGRSAWSDGTIASGAIVLDSDYDRTSDLRRLLRTHELGHALGYNHVQSRISIMNPSIGPELSDFDRMAAQIAFGAVAHITTH
jgi:hypothetical protein